MSPIAVVTGANRGIGLELCRQLHGRGDEVIAVCRKPSQALEDLGVRIEAGVDVGSDSDVAGLAARLAGVRIATLVNCAGILSVESLDDLNFEAMRRQFEVNTLGPLRVTAALRTQLGNGSKVAIVTSRMGSIGDNTSGDYYGYRVSKAAVNMVGKNLALDLKSHGIAVILLHPGFVRTDMTGGAGHVDPPESAKGLIERIDALALDDSGSFWHADGQRLVW